MFYATILFACIVVIIRADSKSDWLLHNLKDEGEAKVERSCWNEYESGQTVCGLELSNGLLSRRFIFQPAFGTIDFILNATEEFGGQRSLFRAIEPEVYFELNNTIKVTVGGLRSGSNNLGNTVRAYCNRSSFFQQLYVAPSSKDSIVLRYLKHEVSSPQAPFHWEPGTRHSFEEANWPPKGVTLKVTFALQDQPKKEEHGENSFGGGETSIGDNLLVHVYYEMYDNIPLIAKWFSIEEQKVTDSPLVVSQATVETLAVTGEFGPRLTHGSHSPEAVFNGGASAGTLSPLLHAQTDQAHGAQCSWVDDLSASNDTATSSLTPHDNGAVEVRLNCSYTQGPGAFVGIDYKTGKSSSFSSFRTFLLAMDSFDLTRQTLSRHRLTSTLAPHVTENPIFFHGTAVDKDGFRNAIDQMHECGFEMFIFSFGSGFTLETSNATYLAMIKEQVEYARSKGIEVGGYDLICLDRGHGGYGGNVGDEWVRVGPNGELLEDACFASGWYDKLYSLVDNFINETGLSMLETDGPYGGGDCHSTEHHHRNELDSIYQQTNFQNEFYHAMRERNVYVNQPDNFFFHGGSRTGLGYDENQYSLPRWEDVHISRMGIYDNLYSLLPTQGWMFLPLDQYHGGGSAATFQGHNEAYNFSLAQYLGAGTAACYRGAQLFDNTTNAGQEMRNNIIKWVDFYKAHRQTIIRPVVHLRRPTVQSWDGWLHVNPSSSTNEVGVAMLFNPTQRHMTNIRIRIPLYYTGLSETCK
eukprot:g602.t1